MLKNGMFLVDRYEILDKVGSGGMSDVYKAKDHILGRLVAIKELKSEFSEDVNFVTKFRTEAQSAAGLEHPNIVNIYDVGSENGCHFIVMEYVEGITLKTYIERKGQLSFKEATSIAIQVARGIEAAHNKKITHRDIKPQNIMISTEGKVKVMDFGIARASSSNTISSEVMGSVHYASPEQARNGYVDGRSDIYSLGIVMYEMVTGCVPFDGETTVAIALQHLQEEMKVPSAYAPELPISYEKIVLKCTQKNAERRYQNITELLADLRKSLVSPDEDFVIITPAPIAAKTRVITSEELEQINNQVSETDFEKETKFAENEETESEEEDEDEDGTGFLDPKVEKMMTGVGLVVCLVIVALIVYLGSSIISSVKFGGGKKNSETQNSQVESQKESESESESEIESETQKMLEMIEIVGMSLEEAEKALEEMGLRIFVAASEKSEEADNTVLKQSIDKWEEVAEGTTIVVVVAGENSSVELKEIPNVIGLTENDAVNKIYNNGFTPDKQYKHSDSVAKGNVISQSPQGKTEAEPGTKVTIVISQGKELVKVPSNLVGKYADEVAGKLSELGFEVVEGESQYSDEYEEGVVFKIDKAGKELEKGSKVKIYISLGKEVVEPETYMYDKTYSSGYTPAEGETIISYSYVLTDANGKTRSSSGTGTSARVYEKGISTSSGKLEITWTIEVKRSVEVETEGTEDADGDGVMDPVITQKEEITTKTHKDSYNVSFDAE